MKNLLYYLFIFLNVSICGQDAATILDRVDRNMSAKNRIFESTMVIHGKRNSRTITSKSYSEGTRNSFTEYLSPASEKGTKMLKLGDQLWIYSPSADRTIQISGHMLRQSVMGSDLSYEDMMDDRKLAEIYNAKITGEETIEGRSVWLVELTAKVSNVAYYSQKMWIDKERYTPLKQELFARSGQLLKRTELKDVKNIQGRWYPTTIVYKDMLKEGMGTEFQMTSIKFDQDIPDYIFTKAALKQ
ncbi:MAG TPA: outer membrane lipoprotein-sorting protein [Bacteroidales bacterium]|jgi:outer membrane lipoprotein-sorting protein|nr:outer membrane lipoprotein-sorting protein [Bacteroidales bacterium]